MLPGDRFVIDGASLCIYFFNVFIPCVSVL